MELKKTSKVVFHRLLPPRKLLKVGWRKSYQTVCGVLLQLQEELGRMKEDNLELVWQLVVGPQLAVASLGALV